jgi:hypothetical protein
VKRLDPVRRTTLTNVTHWRRPYERQVRAALPVVHYDTTGRGRLFQSDPRADPRTQLLTEFDEEVKKTRTMLERVPADRGDFVPHPKSMTLARLAPHVAELAPQPAVAALVRFTFC